MGVKAEESSNLELVVSVLCWKRRQKYKGQLHLTEKQAAEK
jgi:hypothetical protein